MSADARALIVTFRTTHEALRGERALKAGGREVELIPVPRQVASDCGFCLLLPADTGESVDLIAREATIESVWLESVWQVSTDPNSEKRKEKRYERIS